MRLKSLLIAAALAGFATLAHAQGQITVKEPYARATIGQAKVSAAYMTIETSTGPDRLIAAASPVAGTVELHTHLHEGGVMKMRQVEAIELAPGKPAVLETGGYHIMMLDLKQPLKAGETILLTLTFEKAGKVEVQVPVRPLRAGHQRH
ncbi:copper chaperone PCu(A)C [Desertibaculum subflavum]|uniref:copper chaperone PCu(A)C n=1 Tax=Desertibaculum subflavum TaxID=2268458 RepID=UPI000E66E7CD